MSYLKRYRSGEHVAVWAELRELGPEARSGPLATEARDVCRELVDRSYHNLILLHSRLEELGYIFASPESALVEADADAVAALAEMENELGTLPLVAHVWYSTIGSLDFRQADHQVRPQRGVPTPPRSPQDVLGLGFNPTLLFQSVPAGLADLAMIIAEAEEFDEKYGEYAHLKLDDSPVTASFLPTGGCASNNEPKAFSLASTEIDDVIYNDGGGDTYFVDELRRAFAWGGFPSWAFLIEWPSKRWSETESVAYRANIESLLPILKEGLAEI